jgi:hypothetical protein
VRVNDPHPQEIYPPASLPRGKFGASRLPLLSSQAYSARALYVRAMDRLVVIYARADCTQRCIGSEGPHWFRKCSAFEQFLAALPSWAAMTAVKHEGPAG